MIDSNHHTRYYKCVPCVQKALSNPPADVDFEDVGASVVETGFVGEGPRKQQNLFQRQKHQQLQSQHQRLCLNLLSI
jgi:hypothetical protein